MTHFARADEPADPFTARQIALFAGLAAGTGAQLSLANSAGLLAWPESRADWVRPGIMLYGASPLGESHASAARLRPVMHLESALIAIRELPAGEPIGYGGRFVCEGPMRVGVVAIGYADGYPRQAPDGTQVAVAGQATRLVGRVSMDMSMVDLTGLDGVRLGDPVELWGAQVPANRVAEACGTIAYELFTGVGARVRRVCECA
jgi:alanine racemase